MTTRIAQFARNVATNYLVATVDVVIFILLTPFVLHQLGGADYAVWVIIQTLGYYLGFFDFGVPEAQIRQQAKLLAQGKVVSLRELNGTVFVIYAAAGVAALVTAVGLTIVPTERFFDIPADSQAVYATVLLVVGATAAFEFIEGGIDGVFEGFQRYDIMNWVHLGTSLCTTIATVVLLTLGFGIMALAGIALVSTVLSIVLKTIAITRYFPVEARPNFGFCAKSWRTIKSFSLWNSLNELMTEGTAHLDKLLIAALLGSAIVTPYSLIIALCAAIFLVAEPITDTFLPTTSAFHQRGDRTAITALLMRGTKLVVLVTLPVTIIIIPFGQSILALWVGPEYVDIHPGVLWLTGASFFFSAYLWTSLNVLLGGGHIKRVFYYSLFEVLLVLCLILALTPNYGLLGLAFAGFSANVLTGLLLFVPAACKSTAVSSLPYLVRTLVAPLVSIIPAALCAIWLHRHSQHSAWLMLLSAVAAAAVTVTSLLVFSTSQHERRRYWINIRRFASQV